MAEQLAVNQLIVGSSPTLGALDVIFITKCGVGCGPAGRQAGSNPPSKYCRRTFLKNFRLINACQQQ